MEHKTQDPCLVAGANLKRFIKNSRYRTQQRFAIEICVDVRTVGRWINEGINDLRIIKELADFFGKSIWDFLSE